MTAKQVAREIFNYERNKIYSQMQASRAGVGDHDRYRDYFGLGRTSVDEEPAPKPISDPVGRLSLCAYFSDAVRYNKEDTQVVVTAAAQVLAHVSDLSPAEERTLGHAMLMAMAGYGLNPAPEYAIQLSNWLEDNVPTARDTLRKSFLDALKGKPSDELPGKTAYESIRSRGTGDIKHIPAP